MTELKRLLLNINETARLRPLAGHASVICLCLALVCFAGCHKKSGSVHPDRKSETAAQTQTVTVTEDNTFDFNTLNLNGCYCGTVAGKYCFVEIDRQDNDTIEGHCYPVGQTAWAEAVPFCIYRNGNDYFYRDGEQEREIRFEVAIDSTSLTGEFRYKWSLFSNDLSLERYHAPEVHTYPEARLVKPQFEVAKRTEVEYAKAPGYWSSYPIRDSRYMKMIRETMTKKIATKELPLTMDLYCPQHDTLKKHPLIVFIHGGAFYFGDKGSEAMSGWCRHFASLGYVTASLNYRMGFHLSGKSIHQCEYNAIQDAHAAFRYLAAHANEYGIDTSALFVAGTSAGAIMALNVAYLSSATEIPFVRQTNMTSKNGKLDGSGNALPNKFRIRGVANMWGAVFDTDVLENRNIPVISFHGTADDIVPYEEGFPMANLKLNISEAFLEKMYGSAAIHKKLDERRVYNEFYPIEGGHHAPYQTRDGSLNQYYYFIQDKMQRFFYHILDKTGPVVRVKGEPGTYKVNDERVACIDWKVTGGYILSQKGTSVEVVWRKDAPVHTLSAVGMLDSGIPFNTSIDVKEEQEQ